MQKDNIKRICLWSGPRNISTTYVFCSTKRHFNTMNLCTPIILKTQMQKYHPTKEILSSMENNETKVIEMMMGFTKNQSFFLRI